MAGVDIISDGELQRDNMIDYFAERLPGVQVDLGSKRFYYDFYDSVVRSKLATGPLGLVDEVRFLRRFTDRRPKVSVSGPHALVKRIRNQHYPSEEAFALDLARVLNLELRELVRAGATASADRRAVLFGLSRGPAVGDSRRQRDGRLASTRTSACTSATATGTASRRGRAATAICSRRFSRRSVQQLIARVRAPRRRGSAAVQGVRRAVHARPRRHRRQDPRRRDRPGFVADRIRRALEVVPAERLVVNPDCGLRAPAARRRVQQARAPWWKARASCGASSRDEQPAAPRRSQAGGSATSSSWSPRLSSARRRCSRSRSSLATVPRDRGRQHHQLCRRRLRPGLRCASAPRCARAG